MFKKYIQIYTNLKIYKYIKIKKGIYVQKKYLDIKGSIEI